VTATLVREVEKLSVGEKIRLAEVLWDEVAAKGDALPVPDSHKRILKKRLAAHLKSPESSITIEEFRSRITKPF
jgi:putative addiction module component (TIGR02574 family)